MSNKFQWISYGETHPGKKRTINQDAFTNNPDKSLWAVADGMGGHQSGEIASQAIVNALNTIEQQQHIGQTVKKIHCELGKVNQYLIDKAKDLTNDVIGSTAVILIAQHRHCIYLWSGDSRIYLFRDNCLKQLTHDHCILNQLIENGASQADAEKNPYAQALTHAVGVDDLLYIDAVIHEVKDNDIFLLCSDGLTKEISDEKIEHLLQSTPIDTLTQELIKQTLEAGASDNVTVVLAKAASIANG